MGVKGLHNYVERRLPPAEHVIRLADLRSMSGSDTVVVDGMSLIRRLYPPNRLDWVGGGQFQELYLNVGEFVHAFAQCGLNLVVYFDGGVDRAKLSEWVTRGAERLSKCEKVSAALERGEFPPSSLWTPPLSISKCLGAAFVAHGCKIHYTEGEADREIARSVLTHARFGAQIWRPDLAPRSAARSATRFPARFPARFPPLTPPSYISHAIFLPPHCE